MLTPEQNERLTRVGPGAPMGDYLRRYWHPVAGVSEFETAATKPIRLFGEDLVLFRTGAGGYGLIQRHCPHRGADLAYGMIEADGLRCNYHGWCFDLQGDCIRQPFEDTLRGAPPEPDSFKALAYPVEAKAGMLWVYMGPLPAPLVPDWEAFSWPNGFSQVVISTVPCNWLQCQENSIDPVHFEWMHETWSQRLKGVDAAAPRHLKLAFEEFDFGFTYRRTKEDTDEDHENWTVGRVCLWPNAFFLTEHFEWRVPVDDVTTLSVTWKFTRVPREQEPYVQTRIPTWTGPLFDEAGGWITSHVMNQDFLAWTGQGPIADRTHERLTASDRGVALLRRRLFSELDAAAAGAEPKGLIRDPQKNFAVPLPSMALGEMRDGFTKAEIMADPRRRLMFTSYIFQAGQPEAVRAEFEAAMGLPSMSFDAATLSKTLSRSQAA